MPMTDNEYRTPDRRPAKIVFLDRGTLSPDTKLTPFSFSHELEIHDRTAQVDVAECIAGADIVITNKVPISREALAKAPHLKLIAVAATGIDMIDLRACAERNVLVSNIRQYAINTVPEHTFALMLALRRSIIPYATSVKTGRWQDAGQFCYFDYPIANLAGATLGIVGDGVLGKAVADLARAFGMTVLFSAYKGAQGMGPLYTDFDTVMAASDIITLHCPLLPTTRNMIADREFEIMARKPLLINTSRGGLVCEDALERALRNGRIAGAAFDVVTSEPPARDHPFMRLAAFPNFILTPHVAWASQEAVQGLADQLVENIELFMQGKPRHLASAASC
jgi:glycerate dehydrogenase